MKNESARKKSIDDLLIRLFDIAASLILLTLAAPCFPAVILLNLVFLGPPLFYVSRREGRNGRSFGHVKFRSLLPGRAAGRIFFEQERLTRYGRLLRRFHVDELPELILILAGHMSFVGPRPLPAALLAGLDGTVRRSVRPGWTGPAQLQLLSTGRLDKREQISLDADYVRERSFARHLDLLARTLRAALRPTAPDLDPALTADRRTFRDTLAARGAVSVPPAKPPGRERIAVIDWGIGGLPFFTGLTRRYPRLPVLYFSDSGAPPYGRLSHDGLHRRLRAVFAFLISRGVTRVIAACNTISSVLPLPDCPLPVTGVIDAAVAAVIRLRPQTAGVVGTHGTVHSGCYRRALEAHGIRVKQQSTQPLAALIEKGRGRSPRARRLVRHACRALRGVDVLVLACTHYVAVKDLFQAWLPGTRLVDPAAETLEHPGFSLPEGGGEDQRLAPVATTGPVARTVAAAEQAFGISIDKIERVTL